MDKNTLDKDTIVKLLIAGLVVISYCNAYTNYSCC